MRSFLLIFLASTSFYSTQASAQGQEASPFEGPYVGAQVGWGERSATFDLGITRAKTFEQKRSGVEGGAFAGYRARIGESLVAGIEADVGIGGKTLSQDLASDVSASINPSFNAAITGQLGFVASNKVMIYGLGGYGGERLKTDIRDGTKTTLTKEWSDGFVYGGGIAVALSSAMAARVQYRHLAVDGGYSPDQIMVGTSIRF